MLLPLRLYVSDTPLRTLAVLGLTPGSVDVSRGAVGIPLGSVGLTPGSVDAKGAVVIRLLGSGSDEVWLVEVVSSKGTITQAPPAICCSARFTCISHISRLYLAYSSPTSRLVLA